MDGLPKKDDGVLLAVDNLQTSSAPLELHLSQTERSDSLASSLRTSRWPWVAGLACVAVVVILSVTSVEWRSSDDDELHYECLYPVGGGPTRPTGGFPQTRLQDNPECKEAFDEYFAPGGQYFKDLEEAGTAAMKYYEANYFANATAKQLLVFDIDETTLSNLKYELSTDFQGSDEQWQQWESLAEASAIDPVLKVYQAAYASGMSVAFVTGRFDSGRVGTAKNLENVGYGTLCDTDEAGTAIRSSPGPCYIRLDMRDPQEDADKPASVYKPERRQQMLDQGYELAGCFGDQFSDLEGADEAVASWKIPNPMYFIL